MVERLETDFQRRLQAGAEAIELLDLAGFVVQDADVSVGHTDDIDFQIEADLAVGEHTRPLQALEDEDASDSPVFAYGFALGLFAAAGCDLDDCEYDIESGTCDDDECSVGE